MAKIVNLTPHAVRVILADGSEVVIEPSGHVARVAQEFADADPIQYEGHSLPVRISKMGAVEGLPDPAPDTVYIVSALVLQAVQGRHDVVAPDTSPTGAVRDANGQIIGVRGFQRAL